MGRPRKPLADHKRDGTYRGDRHARRENEVVFDGQPKRPAGMSKTAIAHWNSIVPMLAARGVVTGADVSALVALCECWDEYQVAKRIKRKAGDLRQQRTRLMMINSAIREWRVFAAKLGLTPVDRLKIETDENRPLPPPSKEKKPGVVGFVGFRQQRKAQA